MNILKQYLALCIGYHKWCGAPIHRLLNTQCPLFTLLNLCNLGCQLPLHLIQSAQHPPDFIISPEINLIIVGTSANRLEVVIHLANRHNNTTPDQ